MRPNEWSWRALRRLGGGMLLALSFVAVSVASGSIRGSERTEGQSDRSIWDGVYTDEQAMRGLDVYVDACSDCHGQSLEGGEMEPPLSGSEFMYAWNGLSVGDLFERLRVSMPPSNPMSVNRQEKADLIAYLLSRNAVPSGSAELPPRAGTLRAIRIDAARP